MIATVSVHRLKNSTGSHCPAHHCIFHTLFGHNESEQQSVARNRQLVVDAALRCLHPVEHWA